MIEIQSPRDVLRAAVSHIPEEARRIFADGMSDFRSDAGEDMAALLEDRSPEERTWMEGLMSAAISSTDYWDGLLTEDLPPSDDGREKDRRGDVRYVMPQQRQQTRSGEVPPAHYRLKRLREGGMGTRIGRGILAGIGMAANKRRDASDIVSATLATGIANTVLERRDVIVKGEDSNYYVGINRDPEFMEEARIRKDAIQPFAEAGLTAGTFLLAAANSESVQSLIPKAKPAV